MKPELILVANAAMARLFLRAHDQDPLLPQATFENPAARMKASERGDDRLGHESSDHHAGGVSFQPHTDPQHKQRHAFAQRLAHEVDQALLEGRCGRVTLFASNPFLGELKASLSAQAVQALRGVHELDLCAYGLSELERRIAQALHAV